MTTYAIDLDSRRNPKPEPRPGRDYPWDMYPADDPEDEIL